MRPESWWLGLLTLALAAVHIGHMVAIRNAGWGTSEARLSLQYVLDNLRVRARVVPGNS